MIPTLFLLLIIWIIGAIFTISLCWTLEERGHTTAGMVVTFLFWPLVLGDVIGQHIANAYEEPDKEPEEEEPKE